MRNIGLVLLILSIGIAFININIGLFVFGFVIVLFGLNHFQSKNRGISYVYFVFGLLFIVGTLIKGF